MNKNTKLTVSVGIPVYNEANTIAPLLKSILKQTEKNYSLDFIYVICDAPTDNTVKIASDFASQNPKIIVINDLARKGKLKRLEQFYKLAKSEVLIAFDGDLMLKNRYVIENLCKHFANKSVGLVGGNGEPVQNNTFVSYALYNWIRLWYFTRRDFKKGNNIHNIRGCSTAIRKVLAQTVVFPKNYASESQFLFFHVLKSKYKFVYADDAVVYHNIPSDIKDYLTQKFRPAKQKSLLLEKFGEWINPYYEIPFKFKLKGVCKAFLSDPLGFFVAIVFQLYISYKYKKITPKVHNGIWNSVTSTKKAFSV